MGFKQACTLDEIWEGDMLEVEVADQLLLLVCPREGEVHAYQGMCPHQDIPLSEGRFDGKVIMCRAHQWTFDACNGHGLNPDDCRLAEYPVRIEGDAVLVDVEGVTALFSHS